MNSYKDILKQLGYPLAAKMCDEKVASLFATFRSPPDWYGFPPALIPVMRDGTWPLYIGLWKHWSVSRTPSFVELNVGNDYHVVEIARTDRQLALLMILRLIVLKDDLDADVRWLSSHLEISESDLSRLDAFTQEHGDDPKKIHLIPEFSETSPAYFSQEIGYDGEFQIRSGWHNAGLEVDHDVSVQVIHEQPWLADDRNKQDLFYSYLEHGDFGKAWLTLNSRGWAFPVAAKALRDLKSKSSNQNFLQICDHWIVLAESYVGGY